MNEFDAPEITRVDITAPILEVIAWSGQNPADFSWFEAPPTHAIERACSLLQQLGALERHEFRLTDLGRQILELPTHPRLARMLIEGQNSGCPQTTELTARAAAILSERDFVTTTAHDAPTTDSDLLIRAEILPDAARGRSQSARLHGLEIHSGRARRTFEAFQQLHRALKQSSTPKTTKNTPTQDPETAVLRAIASAFPDRVCIAQDSTDTNQESNRRYTMTGGEPLVLATESTVRNAQLLVASVIGGQLHAHHRNRELMGTVQSRALIRVASRIEHAWLDQLYPGRRTLEITVTFDDQRERVMAHQRESFDTITLSETIIPISKVADDALIAQTLAKKASESLSKTFAATKESQQFLNRLNALRSSFPELDVPDFFTYEEPDPNQPPSIILHLCCGKRDFDALRRIDLPNTLKNYLTHAQIQTLDQQIPSHFTVPSGSQIHIDYQPDQPPILPVRIQEVFGLTTTPTVANGRIPLTLHPLAPNYRAVQITQDLPSFWANTYPEVRKELRARYHRHPWPEDPTTAQAIRK